MRSLISRLKGLTEFLLLAMLLLVGWGSGPAMAQWFTSPGGGSGGFAGRPLITVELYVDNDQTSASVPVNLAGVGPNPSLPYTRTLTAVVRQDGRLFPTNIQFDLAPNLASGALFDPEDLTQGFRSLPLENTSGIATAFFHASSTPGEVTITASAQDPNTGQSVSASVRITVVDEKRPPAAITFTGPYVNAVIAGQSQFGGAETPILNGSYSRVISVVVNDLNGNPTNPNTQVNFYLIDGPITGYPSTPGAFFVAGSNGDPSEGQFSLSALDPSGNFISKGVRPYDRLVLDGRQTTQNPLPNNAFHTGVWSVQSVVSETALTILPSPQGRPFNAGDDNGFTVPYVVGRAQNAAVLSPSFTDLSGVASTMLTYPVERVGQTAIVVACVANTNTCGILNTCDRNGANCKSAYLGVTNGSDRTLTVSATSLGPNRSTDVQMCLRDVNFTPLPATEIRYDIGSRGPAKVTVNGLEDNPGKILTGENGCTVAKIASSGQIPGSQEIPLQFTADYVAEPATVTIRSPGAGKMDGFFTCVNTPSEGTGQCEGTLRLTDDEGSPMADVLIALGSVVAPGEFELTFNPADGVFGKTDVNGQLQVTVEMKSPGEYTFPFQTASGGTATYTLTTTVTAPGALAVTLVGATEASLGLPYSATLQAEGGVPPVTWTLTSGSLPPGVSLNANGSISGTPTQEGTFSFAVQAKDKNELTGFGAFTITVGRQADLTVTLDPTLGAVNAPFSGVVSATGGTEPYSFTLLAGSLPPGLSLNASGTLSGTPTAVGTFAFSVKATDSKGATGTGNFSLTISSASPVIVTLEGGGTGQVGVPFTDGVVTATGGAPPYTFRETTGVLATAGLSLSSSGAITGTPTRAGALTFTVEASDRNGLKGTGTITVTISESGGGTGEPLTLALNTLPAATAGTPYSTVIGTASGGTAPYTFSLENRGNLPADITLSASGVLSGTFSAAGTYNFVVKVSDASSPAQASIANATVTVTSGGGTGVTPTQLTLLTSSPDLPSSGQNPVTLTAIARDSGGVLLQDVTVNFQIRSGDGSIQIVRATTDETGTAQALLSTGGNQRNRTLVVGASAGAVTATDVTVNVTGTTLEVSGATSGTIPLSTEDDPNPVKLTFALKDSAGTGIAGATVVVTGAPGGSRSLVTNSSGLAEVELQFSVAGDYSINAFWDNNSANATTTTLPLNLTVSNDSFTITVTDSVTSVNDVVGIAPGLGNVRVEWRRNGALVPGATITLSTNKGTLGLTSGGNPLVTTISSTVPGPATITATGTSPDPAVSPVTNQRTIQFTATAPDTLTLQANPSSISVNVPPSTSSQSTITATVRDAVQNPVANVDVAFEITQDVSGGSLSSGTAKTNFSGQASVVYTAGTSPTPENGVIIRATFSEDTNKNGILDPGEDANNNGVIDVLTQEVNLTVSRREVFITLGTGNTVTEPDPTTYALPYNVLVNDIVGGAVSGATVTLDTVPAQYRKGQYFWNGVVWVPVISVSCPNEDTNSNGILDPGEDTNGNGRLDPGNVVTTSVGSVVTDLDGFGKFDVLYAQQYANWINNVLTARTKVGGSEDVEVANFVLPGLAADFNSEDQSPPGQPSPFGVLPKCDLSVEDEASLFLTAAPNPLSLPVGGAALGPLSSVNGTITVTADLVPTTDLTGATIVANANSANVLIDITVPSIQTVLGNDALFSVTVENTSTTNSVPVAVGGTQVGTITFAIGEAKVVVPVNLTQ